MISGAEICIQLRMCCIILGEEVNAVTLVKDDKL